MQTLQVVIVMMALILSDMGNAEELEWLLLLLLSRFSRVQLCATLETAAHCSHPWDSPGKHTGVGCHFLLQCMKVKSESEVAQSVMFSGSRFVSIALIVA